MKNFTSLFDLKQRVWINEIEREGMVLMVSFDVMGINYKVRYFIDGVKHEVDFYEHELSEVK